jgi:four helix bundle protein
MKDFRNLMVWGRAHSLVLRIHEVTAEFPDQEVYGITAQLRRSAASVPANIAEGCGRIGDGEFARFLQIAMGSASETQYHLILAKDLGLLGEADINDLLPRVEEVKRMLASLITLVRRDRDKGRPARRHQTTRGDTTPKPEES